MATDKDKAAASSAATSVKTEVDATNEHGEVVVTFKVGSADAEEKDPLRRIASRITGWSKFILDGKPYPYSKENAVDLLIRFPIFVKQIEKA